MLIKQTIINMLAGNYLLPRYNKKLKATAALLLLVACAVLPQYVMAQQQVQQWERFEASFTAASYKGNAFDITFRATFKLGDTAVTVDGFYDGGNVFKVRFMPEQTGVWQYVTASNNKSLNNQKGSFECVKATGSNHGIVRVSDTYHFKFADGSRFYPVGTTSYAWNHMGKALQQLTLQSLRNAGFNKLRMCVFPKNYDLVKEEPEIYPFNVAGPENITGDGNQKKWDLATFNVAFFKVLEQQVDSLKALNIETDLILFHPYDKGRWGFDSLSMTENKRYLRYIMARLGSFRNIWWSVANEWDLVKPKTHDEWIELSKYIYDNDPYHHLSSIHGSTAKYIEYWLPWFTHASIQDEAPVMNRGAAAILRNAYLKPVIYDEVGYEGNLRQRWGRYSGEEMNHLVWMGIIGGTYVTHGEAYMFRDETDTIFWAKGGTFKGSSWRRAAFLRKILEAFPAPLEPSDISRDMKIASGGAGNYLVYFGKEINEYWYFDLPVKNGPYAKPAAGKQYKVEIIDTWDMTITQVPDVFETGSENDYRFHDKDNKKVWLPAKPYLALRITEIN